MGSCLSGGSLPSPLLSSPPYLLVLRPAEVSVSLSPGLYPQHLGHPPSPHPGRNCHPDTPPRWHSLALSPTVLLPSGACDVTSRHGGGETRCLALLWLHLVSSALLVPPALPAGRPQRPVCPESTGPGPAPASLPAESALSSGGTRGLRGVAGWHRARAGRGMGASGRALLPSRGRLSRVWPRVRGGRARAARRGKQRACESLEVGWAGPPRWSAVLPQWAKSPEPGDRVCAKASPTRPSHLPGPGGRPPSSMSHGVSCDPQTCIHEGGWGLV